MFYFLSFEKCQVTNKIASRFFPFAERFCSVDDPTIQCKNSALWINQIVSNNTLLKSCFWDCLWLGGGGEGWYWSCSHGLESILSGGLKNLSSSSCQQHQYNEQKLYASMWDIGYLHLPLSVEICALRIAPRSDQIAVSNTYHNHLHMNKRNMFLKDFMQQNALAVRIAFNCASTQVAFL